MKIIENRGIIMAEKDLYRPMCIWLEQYLKDKYKGYSIIVEDTSQTYLEDALMKNGIEYPLASGLKIQIDVLGIAIKGDKNLLFFIEAKKGDLSLKDLGQLWIYSQLADPEEAYLMTPKGFGAVGAVINVLNRLELIRFGNGKKIKEIKMVQWNIAAKSPNWHTLIPK